MASLTKKGSKELPIVTIDPVLLEAYISSNNTISFFNINKSSPKNQFYISYLYTKDIISGIAEVSRRLEGDEVGEAIEVEAYEALGLDPAVEYKLIHFETESSEGKDKAYNVFAFDSEMIAKTFQETSRKTKYIDYITAAPFLFEALYTKKILEGDGIDCFVYFQKHDAFIAIYQTGKYLYSKSLHYSLLQINEKFSELLRERIDEEAFYKTLASTGLKNENNSHEDHIIELFTEIFDYINDVIIFFKRSYNIEDIDNIYIGSEVGPIDGIISFSQNHLGIKTHDLLFNVVRNKDDHYIDQMHILMLLTAQEYIESKDEDLNLTIFQRPPAFSKRPSGMLTLASLFALIASLAYPIYQYGHGTFLQIDSSTKNKEYNVVHKKANELRNTLAQLDKKKEEVSGVKNEANEKLNFRENILDEIHTRKVNYPMKGVMLDELIKLINGRNIKVAQILGEDDNTTITLRSTSNKKLTELLKDIAQTDKYSVITKEIVKQDNVLLYESNITTRITK